MFIFAILLGIFFKRGGPMNYFDFFHEFFLFQTVFLFVGQGVGKVEAKGTGRGEDDVFIIEIGSVFNIFQT